MPIKLYHGTVERIAKQTPTKGLKPYTASNDELIFSNEEKGTITLTNVYGAFQAFYAAEPSKDEHWAIIELSSSMLKESDMQSCKEWAKSKLRGKNATWQKSIETVGMCVYHGLIPAAAIAKVWTYNPQSNWMVTRSVLHTKIGVKEYAEEYKKLSVINRWLTGDFVTLDEWLGEQKTQFTREQKEEMNTIWTERSGLNLFYRG